MGFLRVAVGFLFAVMPWAFKSRKSRRIVVSVTVQIPCDQTLGFAGLDAAGYQLATFPRGNPGGGESLWLLVILAPQKLDLVSLLIEDAKAVREPPAHGLPVLFVNSKGRKRPRYDRYPP